MLPSARARIHCIRALLLVCLATLGFSTTLSAQTLVWNPNSEPDLAGYIVQYGTQSGSPSTSINVGNVTTRQITGLTPGTTYYFRVVAYNSSGLQSPPSSQVSYAVPITPPPSPTVIGLSPTSGPTAGGTVITITGTNFSGGPTVRVGGTSATGVTLVSATQIRATTPAGTAGAKAVQVTVGSTTLTSPVSFTYTAPAPTPTLTSVSPTSGPTAGGTTITLTGTNFVSGATVRVGGTAATNVVFGSATQVTARTPAGTAGARDVQITNPSGQSVTRTGAFTYTAPATAPALTSVSPTSGPTAGGTTITLTGTNFVSGATVRVGGAAATNVVFGSATQVTARTPAGTAGARDVQITNPSGQSATRTGAFTYTTSTAPTLTSVSPTSGPTAGGTTITLTGTNFVSGATVRVGTTAATNVVFVSATRVTARTPAGTAGTRDVRITNPGGLSATRTGAFTYTTGTPAITSITPNSGPTTGGTVITIRGSNFVGGLYVNIGGLISSNTQVISSTEVRTTTPRGYVGARDVTVRVPNGTIGRLVGGFTYTSTTGSQTLSETESTDASSATVQRYLAEGVVSDQMSTSLAIANPDADDAQVRMTFMTADGVEAERTIDVPARARRTVDLREVPELAGQAFSTLVEADRDVAVDRLMSSDANVAAASLATAVDQASPTWSFAEGSTADPYELFYLVQNPGPTPATVRVRYLLPGGAAITRGYTVAAGTRSTIWVDRADPALASTDVAAEISSTDGTPIVVERSLYVRDATSAAPRSVETSAGVTTPDAAASVGGSTTAASALGLAKPGPEAARWLLAEAELGGARQAATAVAVTNRGAATDVTVTLLFEDGPEATATFPLAEGAKLAVPIEEAFPSAAGRRFSVLIEGADASASLVVDRTIAWQVDGATRTAGADGAGQRLK